MRLPSFSSTMSDDDNDDDDYGGSWVVDGAGGGGGGISYVKSNKSKPMSGNDTQHVLKRLKQYTQAKHTKDHNIYDAVSAPLHKIS